MLEQYHVPVPDRLDPKELTQEAHFVWLVACVYSRKESGEYEEEKEEYKFLCEASS